MMQPRVNYPITQRGRFKLLMSQQCHRCENKGIKLLARTIILQWIFYTTRFILFPTGNRTPGSVSVHACKTMRVLGCLQEPAHESAEPQLSGAMTGHAKPKRPGCGFVQARRQMGGGLGPDEVSADASIRVLPCFHGHCFTPEYILANRAGNWEMRTTL